MLHLEAWREAVRPVGQPEVLQEMPIGADEGWIGVEPETDLGLAMLGVTRWARWWHYGGGLAASNSRAILRGQDAMWRTG